MGEFFPFRIASVGGQCKIGRVTANLSTWQISGPKLQDALLPHHSFTKTNRSSVSTPFGTDFPPRPASLAHLDDLHRLDCKFKVVRTRVLT